jgi:hypothetical protein
MNLQSPTHERFGRESQAPREALCSNRRWGVVGFKKK